MGEKRRPEAELGVKAGLNEASLLPLAHGAVTLQARLTTSASCQAELGSLSHEGCSAARTRRATLFPLNQSFCANVDAAGKPYASLAIQLLRVPGEC